MFKAALYFKSISDNLLESTGPGVVGKFSCGKKCNSLANALGLQCAGTDPLQGPSQQHVYQSRLCQAAWQLQISHFQNLYIKPFNILSKNKIIIVCKEFVPFFIK